MSFRPTGYTELLGYRRSVSSNSAGDTCVTWRCGCEVRVTAAQTGERYEPCRRHERRKAPRRGEAADGGRRDGGSA